MSNCINCIWQEFSKPLKNFIKKRISNEQDTDDVLQEVFIKIHNNIDSLTDNNKIHAWVYKITRNTIVDYYRRNNNNIELTELPEDIESSHYEDLSANSEIADCLKVMIDSLPEKYKQAVLLTEIENMTQKELSENLGISISGAKTRVQRARKILKEKLTACCYLEMDRRGNIIDYKHKSSDCKYC